MVRRLVAVVAVAACYEPGELPEPCQVTCDFAGEGTQAACPTGSTCVGTEFLGGICVEPDDPVSCRPPVPAFEDRAFSEPMPLEGLSQDVIEEDDPTLTGDQLEIFFLSAGKIMVATRESTTGVFETPTMIPELDDEMLTELRPCVSEDGLTMLFARDLDKATGAATQHDIFITRRPSRTDSWQAPESLPGDINTDLRDELPAWISPDLLTLVFEAEQADGTSDLFIATRESAGGEFSRRDVRALATINTALHEGRGVFDATGTIFLFEAKREPQSDGTAIWEAFADPTSPKGWSVLPRPELNSPFADGTPWVSPDGKTVVFSTNRGDGARDDDLFIATRQ